MKIYDCFIFFNELDLLDIRLNTLNEVVDYFVLVESKKTFSKNDKPLFYQENKHLFKEFEDKIIHIVLDDLPNSNAWGNEYYQRNAISRGLINCQDSDIIIISDVDEIPNPLDILSTTSCMDNSTICGFNQKLYYYYINMYVYDNWIGSKMCSFHKFKEFNPQSFRMNGVGINLISNGGWHFSYVGGLERIKYKIESFAHQEINNDAFKVNIESRLEKGVSIFDENFKFKIVDLDSTYPKYILNNLEKFKHLIKN